MATRDFIRLGVWRKRYVEQRRGRWVDRLGEEHETLREDVSCEPQDGVAIDARMLEVDACCTVCADDNLELYINTAQSTTAAWCQSPFLRKNTYLVIPPVRAGAHLLTALEAISPAQEVAAQIGEVLWSGVVEADNEECVVDDIETRLVVPVFRQHQAKPRPDFSVLGREHANSTACDLKSR